MTYKVRKTAYRAWPVTVNIHECDAQGVVTPIEYTFIVHFAPFTEDDLKRINAAADTTYPLPDNRGEVEIAYGLKRSASIITQLVVGWGDDVQDESGTPLPYSAEELERWITGPDGKSFVVAFNEAVLQIRFGVAPVKNSNASLAPGGAPAASEAATSSSAT